MKKVISILALLLSACGAQPEPAAIVQSSTYSGWTQEAEECCDCLERTGCLVPAQNTSEKLCRPEIDEGGSPMAISSCLAGEPGEYPQGLCTDECAVLF